MNWKLIRFIDRYVGIPLIYLLHFCRGFQRVQRQSAAPQRVLLIKFWGIGNIFMLLPTIKAIRSKHPSATIDFLTLKNNYDALKISDSIQTITTLDMNSLTSFITTSLHALRSLRKNRYDLIIDFEQFSRFSALLTHLVKAPVTTGFKTREQHRHFLYTAPVEYNDDIHITRSFYSLAEFSGLQQGYSREHLIGNHLKLKRDGKVKLRGKRITTNQPVVIMHIGTSDNFKERRWSPLNFAALTDLLTHNHGVWVVLTGLPDESHLIQETLNALNYPEQVTDLGGKLSFDEYFELVAASDLVVSADTAAVHIASALAIPVVGLYGPNTPRLYGPWGENGIALSARFSCSPCITNFNAKINTCRHPSGSGACMMALSVEQVYEAITSNHLLPDSSSDITRDAMVSP